MICVQLTLSVKKMMYVRRVGKGNKGKAGRGKDNICITNLTPYNGMLSVFYSLIGRFSVNIFITALN